MFTFTFLTISRLLKDAFRKHITLTLLIIFALSGTLCLRAQGILESIEYIGLNKTKPSIISRQLLQAEGQKLDSNLLKIDLQRILNFPGVGNATYTLDSLGDAYKLTYHIQEQSTLLPLLNFGGVKGNVWYQMGFYDSNFLGFGNFFSAHYQNSDGRHSGQLFFRSPKNVGKHWGYSVSLARWASIEPLFFPSRTVNYNFDYNSVSLTGIYNIGYRRQIEFGGNYFVENYEKLFDQETQDLPGPNTLRHPKLLGKISYYQNYLNYHFFYLDGHDLNVLFQDVYNTKDQSFFHILMLTWRYFKNWNDDINLASRLNFGISSNDASPFAPFVVDSRVNLRGAGNRIDRGTGQLVWNVEFRKTLFHKNSWAAQWVVFSDLGTWRNPGGRLNEFWDPKQFRHFIGLGGRVIYMKIYGAVLRIDYGVDVYNTQERGVVLGFGQYF
jgi:outer membrane protein assembly factor BamA